MVRKWLQFNLNATYICTTDALQMYIKVLRRLLHFYMDSTFCKYHLQLFRVIPNNKFNLKLCPYDSYILFNHLSLKGKITVINNLALSPLIYVSSIIHTPTRAINEINNIIQNFIRNSKNSNSKHRKWWNETMPLWIKNCSLKITVG